MHFAVFSGTIQSCRGFFWGLGSGVAVLFLCLCFDLERGEGMDHKCIKYGIGEKG
jgi:hypothetical protein